ncbi:MAG TPA: hypothetical protein VIH26_09190, partial [Anaerolineales bacterium]
EDPGCSYEPIGGTISMPEIHWSGEARARLERIPIAFIRQKVERGVEAFARSQASQWITEEVMRQALAGFERPPAFQLGDSTRQGAPAEVERLL